MNEPARNIDIESPPQTEAPVWRPAGFGARAVGLFLDNLFVFLATTGFSFAVSRLIGGPPSPARDPEALKRMMANPNLSQILSEIGPTMSVGAVWAVIFPILYFGFFNKYKGGTPGKLIMGLRLQNFSTGENIGFLRTILREFIGKPLSFLILGLGYFLPLANKNKRALHDFVAGTWVVTVRGEESAAEINEEKWD